MIYADNAATTKLDNDAFEAMKPYLLEEYGNASQSYIFARKPKQALLKARETIAECINALPEEIYFTSGGTESNNWAIKGAAIADFNKKKIVTSALEHYSLLNSCKAIKQLGYPVDYLMPTINGNKTIEMLENIIMDTTHLVSIMYANNEIGSVQPIKELCEVAHLHGALFHTDAVQAVGHEEINVQKLGVDMLSASAHKFNGPKGIGFLYIRKGTKISPYADGGAQERHYRAGTENVASIVGMAVALKKNHSNLKNNIAHVKSLEYNLIEGLRQSHIPFVHNGGANKLPGLLSLSFNGADGEVILHRMDLMGICISTGSACNNVNTEISHVLKAIKLDESLAKGTIRISFGKNNTLNEVESIIKALNKILND